MTQAISFCLTKTGLKSVRIFVIVWKYNLVVSSFSFTWIQVIYKGNFQNHNLLYGIEWILNHKYLCFSSVQSLSHVRLFVTHGLQHTRLPCLSPTPRACSNWCPSSWWCHPTISPSVVPFSSCLQSFPASGSLPMSQLFASGGQSTGVSASTSNEHPGLISFRIDWLDLLAVQGTQESSPTPQFKSINSFVLSFLYGPTCIHDYWKNHRFD